MGYEHIFEVNIAQLSFKKSQFARSLSLRVIAHPSDDKFWMADRASMVPPPSIEVGDVQVGAWREEIKAITDLSAWASYSELDKVEILTKLSFVLSNLWTTEEDTVSFDHAFAIVLNAISMSRNDEKVYAHL